MASSKTTVERILDAAVELFAEQGFEQTSVRDITTAAGVNLASVNYHFGSRDALVQAVAERYLTPLCQDMMRQLDDHEANNADLDLEALLELLISAMLKAVEPDAQGTRLFMRLLSQAYMSADGSLRAFLDRRYGHSFKRLLDRFRLQVPQLTPSEFYWRCHFLVGAAVLPLARHGLLSEQEQLLLGRHATETEVFHRLVAFLAGGLRAEADQVTQKRPLPQPSEEAFSAAKGTEPDAPEGGGMTLPKARIKVDLTRQLLSLFDGDRLYRRFSISSARNGAGEQNHSGCTPRGLHQVRAKIGAGCALNAVFVGRRPTGELYSDELAHQAPDRDWILCRILWLSGCEPGFNRLGGCDSMQRYIYIHGTPDTEPMGQPLSHGCIRMRNEDLIWLFDQIAVGTQIQIDE